MEVLIWCVKTRIEVILVFLFVFRFAVLTSTADLVQARLNDLATAKSSALQYEIFVLNKWPPVIMMQSG